MILKKYGSFVFYYGFSIVKNKTIMKAFSLKNILNSKKYKGGKTEVYYMDTDTVLRTDDLFCIDSKIELNSKFGKFSQ